MSLGWPQWIENLTTSAPPLGNALKAAYIFTNLQLAGGNASPAARRERAVMSYLPDPVSALLEMVVVKVLSSHASDEQTLNEENALIEVGGGGELVGTWMAGRECRWCLRSRATGHSHRNVHPGAANA